MSVKLNLPGLPRVHFSDPKPYLSEFPLGIKIDYEITIVDGNINVYADTLQWNETRIDYFYTRVAVLVRSIVDLFSFGTGHPFVITLDSYIPPDGKEKQLVIYDPKLGSLCTLATPMTSGFALTRALPLIIQQPNIGLALRDLINGITYPDLAAIDCARAIEVIRHIMDPNINKRGTGWGKLQDALNISRTYREMVSDISANPRHGDISHLPEAVVIEVTQRAWTIMNRFIELKLRGVDKLPLDEFGLLS
jgi:hypothetical protein